MIYLFSIEHWLHECQHREQHIFGETPQIFKHTLDWNQLSFQKTHAMELYSTVYTSPQDIHVRIQPREIGTFHLKYLIATHTTDTLIKYENQLYVNKI